MRKAGDVLHAYAVALLVGDNAAGEIPEPVPTVAEVASIFRLLSHVHVGPRPPKRKKQPPTLAEQTSALVELMRRGVLPESQRDLVLAQKRVRVAESIVRGIEGSSEEQTATVAAAVVDPAAGVGSIGVSGSQRIVVSSAAAYKERDEAQAELYKAQKKVRNDYPSALHVSVLREMEIAISDSTNARLVMNACSVQWSHMITRANELLFRASTTSPSDVAFTAAMIAVAVKRRAVRWHLEQELRGGVFGAEFCNWYLGYPVLALISGDVGFAKVADVLSMYLYKMAVQVRKQAQTCINTLRRLQGNVLGVNVAQEAPHREWRSLAAWILSPNQVYSVQRELPALGGVGNDALQRHLSVLHHAIVDMAIHAEFMHLYESVRGGDFSYCGTEDLQQIPDAYRFFAHDSDMPAYDVILNDLIIPQIGSRPQHPAAPQISSAASQPQRPATPQLQLPVPQPGPVQFQQLPAQPLVAAPLFRAISEQEQEEEESTLQFPAEPSSPPFQFPVPLVADQPAVQTGSEAQQHEPGDEEYSDVDISQFLNL